MISTGKSADGETVKRNETEFLEYVVWCWWSSCSHGSKCHFQLWSFSGWSYRTLWRKQADWHECVCRQTGRLLFQLLWLICEAALWVGIYGKYTAQKINTSLSQRNTKPANPLTTIVANLHRTTSIQSAAEILFVCTCSKRNGSACDFSFEIYFWCVF